MPDPGEEPPQLVVIDPGIARARRERREDHRRVRVSLRDDARRERRPTWLVLVPTLILALWAAWWV
ncbi:MAG TPA: hypothetical protein VIJ48_08645, partial [Acidimicrobiia bacterium]